MSNTITFTKTYTVVAVEMPSCGHIVYITKEFKESRQGDHRRWYCTICGSTAHWPQESDEERLRRERDAALQREETLRFERDTAQATLVKVSQEAKRLKKRAANGVCPCCTRSFQNLRRHMATKHPDHASNV